MGSVAPGGEAALAGFRPGDTVLRIATSEDCRRLGHTEAGNRLRTAPRPFMVTVEREYRTAPAKAAPSKSSGGVGGSGVSGSGGGERSYPGGGGSLGASGVDDAGADELARSRAVAKEKELVALLRWSGLGAFETKVLGEGFGTVEQLGHAADKALAEAGAGDASTGGGDSSGGDGGSGGSGRGSLGVGGAGMRVAQLKKLRRALEQGPAKIPSKFFKL